MRRFPPHARIYSCFDNDVADQIYAVRLRATVTGEKLKVSKDGDTQMTSGLSPHQNTSVTRISPGYGPFNISNFKYILDFQRLDTTI